MGQKIFKTKEEKRSSYEEKTKEREEKAEEEKKREKSQTMQFLFNSSTTCLTF